ncbi:UNVERIFIED_CONTAM: hypothetical protein NCL1_14576 [Trichonephila clavipes]
MYAAQQKERLSTPALNPLRCILFGLLFGVVITAWIGCGIQISGYNYPPLPLDASGCPKPENATGLLQNSTIACNNLTQCLSTSLPTIENEPFFLYKVSFVWLSTIGFVATLFVVFVTVILTGWRHNAIPATSKCLSPVARFWIKGTNFETQKNEVPKNSEDKIELPTL